MEYEIRKHEFPVPSGSSEEVAPPEALAFADQIQVQELDSKVFPPIFLGAVSGNVIWIVVYIVITRRP